MDVVDDILSLFDAQGPITGVVCGTPVMYLGHRGASGRTQCQGDPCPECAVGPAQHVVLANVYVCDESAMRVIEGPESFADALVRFRERYEPGEAVVEIDAGDISFVRAVDHGLAAALRIARLHVLASRVPGSTVYSATEPLLDETARELRRGLVFVHGMGMQTRYDILDTSSRVLALTEELISAGHVNLRSLDARRDRLRREESSRFQEMAHVTTDSTDDKYELTGAHGIPCGELLPLCKGRCCRFHFSLSLQDVAEGVVDWELDRPYQARKRADGYCAHTCPDTLGCTVYEHRPAVCRTYDCRKDSRVWLDYENRVPAPWGGPEPADDKD
jgi:hypothetical protein